MQKSLTINIKPGNSLMRISIQVFFIDLMGKRLIPTGCISKMSMSKLIFSESLVLDKKSSVFF